MISSPSGIVITGGTFNAINQTKRGFDLLMEWVATDAFHNSKDLCDAPKCHPHTRVAVLDDIMKWVIEFEAQDDFMLWLFGPAGAGKSAIAKKVAELATETGLLIGAFFFSRTSPTRNTQDRLIATLAYQMAISIPETRTYIEGAIERDPAIFHKNIQTQIDTLLIKPFQSASTQTISFPKLIVIDGLDECKNDQTQVAILDAISNSFPKPNLPIIFLVVSRPETDLVSSFNSHAPLKFIHRRLALDDTYHPDDDIRLFFSDKFRQIQCTPRLRSTIPIPWLSEESLETLVQKSSGQFLFATTVVKFVESNYHRPAARLNIILGISPLGTMNPFTELDGLYIQILSSVDDILLTLRVLSLYITAPHLAMLLRMSAESFLSLEEGDIDLALINLASIVSYNESSGEVKILHASFVDFLSDKRRSKDFYIDMVDAHTEFACHTLRYVKGPDGIRAGDLDLFQAGIHSGAWVLTDELRRDILNFNFDAFIAAVIKYYYMELIGGRVAQPGVIFAFYIWTKALNKAGDEQALYRCKNSFELRIQRYQSDCQLQLLFTLAVAMHHSLPHIEARYRVPECRCLDILLEMNDHNLHLVDLDSLDLRHSAGLFTTFTLELTDITSLYVDGDRYASAALHCMHFLSNPPEYSEHNDSAEMGLIYAEWKATCDMALVMLPRLLQRANTSPKLVQFMSNHDIGLPVRKDFSIIRVRRVDVCILTFLSRASVCVNWRILSAIRLTKVKTDHSPPKYKENCVRSDKQEEKAVIRRLIRQRVDQCCNHVDPY